MYKDTLCWIRTSVRCTGVKGKTLISTLIHGTRVVDPGGVDPDPDPGGVDPHPDPGWS